MGKWLGKHWFEVILAGCVSALSGCMVATTVAAVKESKETKTWRRTLKSMAEMAEKLGKAVEGTNSEVEN